MCVDFTDLNVTCSKYLYPLPNIDRLVDESTSYKKLSFIESYSSYNQIKINLIDSSKTEFISNYGNYYYNIMKFRFKNVGLTFQSLMDVMCSKQIGHNMKVYIDDMIVKTSEEERHAAKLEDIFGVIQELKNVFESSQVLIYCTSKKILGVSCSPKGT